MSNEADLVPELPAGFGSRLHQFEELSHLFRDAHDLLAQAAQLRRQVGEDPDALPKADELLGAIQDRLTKAQGIEPMAESFRRWRLRVLSDDAYAARSSASSSLT